MDVHARIVCWGELLWDLFPSGACLGGAPSNVAVHLAAANLPTALITRLGEDVLGRQAQEALEERGLDLRGLQVDPELPTGRVGIEINAEGEARYTLHEGAWRQIACDEPARSLLSRAEVFCYGTLSQEQESGAQSWRAALSALPAQAIRVCDPNLRGGRILPELTREHMRAATVVKLNDGEARSFEKAFGCSDAVRWLLDEMQVDLVALTHGARGATLYRGRESASHGGFSSGAGGDNVGAGDGFTSILARAARAQTPLAEAVEAANLYGSFVASHKGATPRPPTELLEELAQRLGDSY